MKVVTDLADATAGTIAIGALLGYLPVLASLLTIVWTGIRIYEWYRGRKSND